MDDAEIEAALASYDEPQTTPVDVAQRIYNRALANASELGTDMAAADPTLTVVAGAVDPARDPSRSATQWTRTRVLASAAAIAIVAGISFVALRPPDQVVATGTFASPGVEQACQDLAAITGDFTTSYDRVVSEEEVVQIRDSVRTLLFEMRKANVDTEQWSLFELQLAQVVRDVQVGDNESGQELLNGARLRFSAIVTNSDASTKACLNG